MTTITSGNKEFLAVDVLYHTARNFRIHGTYVSFEYLSFGKSKIGTTAIPHGNYKIIGLCSEIMRSDELCIQVVEIDEDETFNSGFRLYKIYKERHYPTTLPTESFASFMTKHSLTDNTLLIEKI